MKRMNGIWHEKKRQLKDTKTQHQRRQYRFPVLLLLYYSTAAVQAQLIIKRHQGRRLIVVPSMSPDLLPIRSNCHFHCYCPPSINVYKFRYSFNPSFPATTSGPRDRWARMEFSSSAARRHRHHPKDKLLVIMGATGTGKSRLSVELATHFNGEIINSDKMQVYKGLDTTTNKIPLDDRLGVPHHLLGEVDSEAHGELTRSEFRSLAGKAVSEITARRKLPVLAGGSNSFIHALLVDRFDPEYDVFDERSDQPADSSKVLLRYNCCFLWVDVSLRVLEDYLVKRVDDMLNSGMFDELAEFYDPEEDHGPANWTGLRKAIGVPEFDRYFERCTPGEKGEWDRVRREAYEVAVREIKANTCQLAKRQIGKILRLKGLGWDLRRLDATEAFRAVMTSDSGKRCSEIWERQVLEPSVKIVKRFLDE
ncbi:adenylate isopentenyltransferase isoform X1 [Morus notabilis]|uniref:adenylate isopentenyltransferase isoform X1 n=1 Tax=Morus notabilis TaxID=981085 RepID=UPI000CED29DC|nr:adenylate isopentenyltransferase isoform X1 [Morus notabilis]